MAAASAAVGDSLDIRFHDGAVAVTVDGDGDGETKRAPRKTTTKPKSKVVTKDQGSLF
jgi:hypothetical protein